MATSVKGDPRRRADGAAARPSGGAPPDRDAPTAIGPEDEAFLLEALMDNVPDTIYFKDRDSRFIRINRHAAVRHGLTSAALAVGLTDFDLFTEEHAAQALRDEQQIIRTGQPLVNVEEKETLPDGQIRWVSTTKMPLRDRRGDIVGTFGISRDITVRKDVEEQLQRRAFYDPLTDLPNRALFLDRLQHLLQRGRRALGNPLFALLYLDLDRFKAINDSLGHQMGDELLIGTARRLERCLRPGDTLARLGGDEFTILLDEISCQADATGVAERIREELTAPFMLRGHEIFTSVSVGIALSSEGYDSPNEMLRDADTAMYRAKAAGHARHQVFDADMHQEAVSSLRLETDLRRALERREIVPFYQPIVDLDDGTVVGFEALARWRHPERGTLLPADFLPLAEDTGLIGAIDEWMLAAACRQARTWQRASAERANLGISVNVSGRHIADGTAPAMVERVLRSTGIDPATLTIEISESALMHDVDAGTRVLQQLRALSVGLRMDDFGAGYSSLAYLHGLPMRALKIARSFVARLDGAPQQLAIVKAIVSLAQGLGMEEAAVGIETEAQVDALRALGCRRGQGWLFSMPLPADAAGRLLDEHAAHSS